MEKEELKYWKRKWELDDNLIYKNAGINQAGFVSSEICGNLLHTHGFVVSTHFSKSCELPVYYVKMRNGIKLIMRNNFYDWKMSVDIPESYAPLPGDFLPMDCLSHSMVENEGDKIASCYMEGFRKEWCYDAYLPKNPPRRFSIEVPDKYRLYIIIHQLKHAYPDVGFRVEDDARTKEQIAEAIERIWNANGYADLRDEKRWGKVMKKPVMSSWEITWQTYRKIDDLYYEHKIDVKELPNLSDGKPMQYAELIMKHPEVHEEFLREEWMFEDLQED